MASAFGHILLAGTLGLFVREQYRSAKFWVVILLCSVIPDLDVIAFKFGIPYSHIFGHRGFTHSILFSFVLGYVVLRLFFESHKVTSKSGLFLFLAFSLSTLSHSILDAMTTGGLGVGFFIPFSEKRFFLPWRPIEVSPISISQFFSDRGVFILWNELFWIGGLCAILLLLKRGILK